MGAMEGENLFKRRRFIGEIDHVDRLPPQGYIAMKNGFATTRRFWSSRVSGVIGGCEDFACLID
jgi:hypothetical protein